MAKMIGIDLGTTNSVVAIMEGKDPKVITDEEGGRLTPSVVGFDDKGDTPAGAECLVVAAPIPGFIMCDSPVNSGPQHWVLKAAIAALDRWVRGEGAPPMAPRLEVAGMPEEFVLDDLGNVRGGIRTPASWSRRRTM